MPTLHAMAVAALAVAPPLIENDSEFGNNLLTLSRDDSDANVRRSSQGARRRRLR
jgi:hypothetical protein